MKRDLRPLFLTMFSLMVLSGLALLVFAVPGCQNPDKRVTTAIGLKTTKDVLVSTATAAKRLCEQGVISEGDCATIQELYTEGRKALVDAKTIWDVMAATDSFDNNKNYNDLIMAVARITAVIENAIRKGVE